MPEELSPDEQIAWLDEQLKKSVDKIYELMFELHDSLAEQIGSAKAIHILDMRAAQAREEEARKHAVTGAILEAYGFVAITVGTFVLAWSSYPGW